MDKYFVLLTSDYMPKNSFHKWVKERFRSYDMTMTEKPKEFIDGLIADLKEIHISDFPRCKMVEIDTRVYEERPAHQITVLGLCKLTIYKIREGYHGN